MAIRVNLQLINELTRFGAEDVQYCYHCGDCSTVCPHADAVFRFPRKSMRQLQMGLEKRIETTLEPWLCYYCGQCSEQCPREADPGETMMSLRRWLIARYDITGLAARFFKSQRTEMLAIFVVMILTGAFLLWYGFSRGNFSIYDGEGAFLPSHFIHRFDLIIGGIMTFFLLINTIRMGHLTMGKGTDYPVPWWLYIKKFLIIPFQFFTQKRYAECDHKRETRVFMPWLVHVSLALGYIIMIPLVMVFIERMQKGPEIDWYIHAFGYLASVGLLIGCIYFIRHRMKKTYVQYKKTHSTDWVFVVFLLIITVTGILQHLFHRFGLLEWANVTYVVHLMAVVPWLLRMPFSKWSHLVYRPVAMYFAAVRREAILLHDKELPALSVTYN